MADLTKMKKRIEVLKRNQKTKPSGVIDQQDQMVHGNTRVRRYLDLRQQLEQLLQLNSDTDQVTADMDKIWTTLTAKEKAVITKEQIDED